MTNTSEIQEPEKMNHEATVRPLSKMTSADSPLSFSTRDRTEDNRRYQIALAVSLAVLGAVMAFGIYVTRF